MTYRRLRADRIFDGEKFLDGKLLQISQNGDIAGLIPDDGGEAEEYTGVISPGFINCHCHLELSHMKGVVPAGEGMVRFLINVVYARKKEYPRKEEAIKNAAEEMWLNGIQGVGDICNTVGSIETKKRSAARWKNFIEVINFFDEKLDIQLLTPNNVLDSFQKERMDAALVPHAPYSVSKATYAAINNATNDKVISIHNQESDAENDLFLTGESEFLDLYREFGNDASPFAVTGKSSLQTWLPNFTGRRTILLVHNTSINEDDVRFAFDYSAAHQMDLVYCICPNANLYIEGRLPPLEMLMKKNCRIVLGTDSYGSNYQLSIAEEIKTLREHFSGIPLETMLQWATSGGADALRWNDLGRFKKGTKPGVVLLDEKNFSVTRIV